MTKCGCSEICRFAGWADQFQPATRELMVFTKNPKRYFDLDAVREPFSRDYEGAVRGAAKFDNRPTGSGHDPAVMGVPLKMTHTGAPPLDWWQIPSPKPQPVTEYEGDPMTATFYVGDAIETMNKLPEKSVDLILTSPPFLALRSYLPADHPDKALEGGSQTTPGAFIDWLIDVVEACDRVLAPHGSLCIELGDTYAGSSGSDDPKQPVNHRGPWKDRPLGDEATIARRLERQDYGPAAAHNETQWRGGGGWPLGKSLSLIPELFRLTLVYGTNPLTGRTTERWRLRNVVRWVRPNPPVGALGDKFRPATSELMVFCKSAKRYFDLDSVREPPQVVMGRNVPGNNVKGSDDNSFRFAERVDSNPAGAPPLDWWNIPLLEGEEETRYGPKVEKPWARQVRASGDKGDPNGSRDTLGPYAGNENPLGSPPLDWWNIPPGGYQGAHYAVFPPELCIKPIKAMCPERVCKVCGEPSRRIVEAVHDVEEQRRRREYGFTAGKGVNASRADGGASTTFLTTENVTTGWSSCGHNDWRPGLVLDPFGGSGTTALVATGHGRDCILIDIDERNYELALQRVGPFILSRADSV